MLFEKNQRCPFGEVTFVPRFLCENAATVATMIDLLLTGDNPFKSLIITERMGNTAKHNLRNMRAIDCLSATFQTMKMPSKGYMAPYCAFGHCLGSSLTDRAVLRQVKPLRNV